MDLADEAQAMEAAHLAAALAARPGLRAEAQERDRNGRVVCLDCGEPIPPARLAAVPDACRCVECQRAGEMAS